MEWVDDSYGGPESLPIRNYGVARGGSYLSFRPKQLTTSIRTPLPENTRDNAPVFRTPRHSNSSLTPYLRQRFSPLFPPLKHTAPPRGKALRLERASGSPGK